ncbi:hypothetical protein Pelo_17203 [Pelomyxa schiedti]|nr:hypothetical protein Pelo_17203 [Pelomyxa schiedti]
MSFYLTDMFPFYGNWDILDLTISTLCLLSQCFITCTLVQIFGSVCFTHCSELSMWACQLHPPPFEQQMQRYTNIKRKILSSSHTFADWLTFMCVVIGMNTVCAIHGGIYTSQDYYTFALSDFLRILCLPIVFLIIAGHILADAAAVSLSLERAVASLSLVTPPDPASTPQQQATTTTPVLLQRHILFSEQLCKSTFTAFGFPLSSSSLSQCVAGIFALTVLMIVISL